MPASTRPCSHGHEKTVHPFTSKYLEAELTGDSGQVGFQPIKANRARYCPNQLVIWLLNGKKYLLMTLASGEGKEARQKNFQTELPGLWSSGLWEETCQGRDSVWDTRTNLNGVVVSYVCKVASSSLHPCVSFTVMLRPKNGRL